MSIAGNNPGTGNPFETAKRFFKQQQNIRGMSIPCPDSHCGGKLDVVTQGESKYRKGEWRAFRGCTNHFRNGCSYTQTLDQVTYEPIGVPANAETRALRERLCAEILKFKNDYRFIDRNGAFTTFAYLMEDSQFNLKHPIVNYDKDKCLLGLERLRRFRRELADETAVVA
jgi:hypothetical protein